MYLYTQFFNIQIKIRNIEIDFQGRIQGFIIGIYARHKMKWAKLFNLEIPCEIQS